MDVCHPMQQDSRILKRPKPAVVDLSALDQYPLRTVIGR
jgi:hypothetical protein